MLNSFVKNCYSETTDVRLLELARCDGEPFTHYQGGSHIDITTPSGLVRQYSLCGEASDSGTLVIAVKNDPKSRGGSRSIHEQLKVGDKLIVGEPRCHFHLDADAYRHILVAAGIGITPLISMAYECLRDGRLFSLHYFSRDIESTAFLNRLQKNDFEGRVFFYHGVPIDELGPRLDEVLSQQPEAHVYTCGPSQFMEAVINTAAKYRSTRIIHKESFQAQEVPGNSSNRSFTVKLSRSQLVIDVSESESIVQALAKIGISIPTSCGEGVCGTCIVPVLEGALEHRDNVLTQDEIFQGDLMCACVSRAKGELITLDM